MAANSKQQQKKTDKDIDALRQELLSEIGTLRILFREIIERYQTNVEADLVACINALSDVTDDGNPEVIVDEKNLGLMFQALKKLKLKPRKGRFKDIRRINDMTTLLYAQIIEQS